MHTKEEKLAAFGRLLDVMDALREKCPWNAEQTWDSIRRLTEEEVYELSDAIMKGESQAVCKEIGDLLYHMAFYARIAQEQEQFDIADSLNKVCDKMVFRHPHVFGSEAGKAITAKEIADTWELVKAREKGGNKTVMEGIPDAMPALLKAVAMQEKARGCGFDWENPDDVWPKVLEELTEARVACAVEAGRGTEKPSAPTQCEWEGPTSESAVGGMDLEKRPVDGFSNPVFRTSSCGTERATRASHKEEEFGDLLFAVINAARLHGVDPEAALSGACSKFRRRFNYVEAGILGQGRTLAEATLSDMDALWDEAKSKGL